MFLSGRRPKVVFVGLLPISTPEHVFIKLLLRPRSWFRTLFVPSETVTMAGRIWAGYYSAISGIVVFNHFAFAKGWNTRKVCIRSSWDGEYRCRAREKTLSFWALTAFTKMSTKIRFSLKYARLRCSKYTLTKIPKMIGFFSRANAKWLNTT